MCKIFKLAQTVLYGIMLILLAVWIVAHFVKGTIGLFGFCVATVFIYLMFIFVRESYREYQQEKNK